MALDRLGNTVTTGTVYVVAGTARVIDGDQIVLVGGNGGETVLRARAGDIARVDDLGGGGGVTDGDKGDVVVSSSGTVWTIDATGTRDDSTFLRGDSTWQHIEATRFPVKNTSGGTLTVGTPVYATGSVGASAATEVAGADAGNAATMPAIGVLEQTLLHNDEGFAVPLGMVRGLDTSAYLVNGTAYVAVGGGLTPTRPTGTTDLIQNIGRVVRVHASTGELLVMGPGRTNDVQNLIPTSRLASSGTASASTYLRGDQSWTSLDASHVTTGTLGIARIATGTSSSTVCIGDDSRLSDDRTASGLRTDTTIVEISSSPAPTAGQVLVATSDTSAKWDTLASGSSSIAFANAPMSNTAINVTSYTALVSKSVTVTAGDSFEIEAYGTLLNNSGATATYRWQIALGSFTLEAIDGTTIPTGATNRATFRVKGIFAVASTSNAGATLYAQRNAVAGANTANSIATSTVRHSFNTTASNLTGTQTIELRARSSTATATQTLQLFSWQIRQVAQQL
jgi:hypothetical protein